MEHRDEPRDPTPDHAGAIPRDAAPSRVARGLVEAGVALTSELALDRVLQVLADVTRDLVGARYAAIGVLDAERTGIANFITSGLTPEQRERMGDPPTGHGILGLLIRDARPIRIPDLRRHPASSGVPPHHPIMRSFLGVPVRSRGEIFGNLYVTNKIDADEFDGDDLAIVELLAAQAAVAIDNARLREQRDRFFAGASHELGNAVTGVRVWAQQLLRRPPAETQDWIAAVAHIARGAEDARRMIDDLLTLNRLQEGRLAVTPGIVPLEPLIREAVELVRPEAGAAGVEILVDPFPEAVSIFADGVRLRQILLNLLGNALKFTPSGRRIEVGAARDGDDVVLRVRDEGPGISPLDRDRVFRPYEQVAGVARGRGAGLGLALSRQLARLMDGEIRLESEIGKGSTFLVRLPCAREPLPAGGGM